MSSPTPAAGSGTDSPSKKPRSPIERVIVWGGICLLLVVVAIEARAKFGYDMSRTAIAERLEDNENAYLSLAEARGLFKFVPAVSEPVSTRGHDAYTYSWFSVFKPGKYQIVLTATPGDDAEVTTFTTPGAPEETPVSASAADLEPVPEYELLPIGDFGGRGSFGPGGFGGGMPPLRDPVLTSLDADSDGEISTDELNAAATVLRELDANGDGQLTRDEFLPRFTGGGSAGGPVEASDRPQRPPLDDGPDEAATEAPRPESL